jgi:hypothetical protein
MGLTMGFDLVRMLNSEYQGWWNKPLVSFVIILVLVGQFYLLDKLKKNSLFLSFEHCFPWGIMPVKTGIQELRK